MTNINELVEQSLILETLPDRLKEIFKKDFIYNLNQFEEIQNRLYEIEKELNVEVIMKREKISKISAHIESTYDQSRHIIHMSFPMNFQIENKEQLEDFINTIFHEISHIITNKKIPEFLNKKTKEGLQKYNTLDYKPCDYDLNALIPEEMKNFLDYIFQIRELPNFAFSIAYSNMYKEHHSFNIQQLYDQNNKIINSFYIDKKLSIQSYNNWIDYLKGDTKILFKIQVAVFFLKTREYKNKLNSLLKLIIKYENKIKQIFDKIRN